MDWKNRYTFKKITNINLIKPGMKAMLIVGNDKAWTPGAWIVDRQRQIFEVVNILPDTDEIDVLVPGFFEGFYFDADEEEKEHICRGDLDWFLFN